MHEDDLTRRVVGALHVEPESPQFFDDLRLRLDTDDRRAVRRWRRAAIGFALAALAATVAAGVLAATPRAAANVVDRTVRCSLLGRGGSDAYFDLYSEPGAPPPGATGQLPKNLPPGFKPLPAIDVETGDTLTVLTLSPLVSGYQLDRTRCAAAHTTLTFGPHGLPQATDLPAAAKREFHTRCAIPSAILRIRITTDQAGIPVRARLLVVRAAGGKPVAYVDWSRRRVTAYTRDADCVPMG
jgi:hypothetical protein